MPSFVEIVVGCAVSVALVGAHEMWKRRPNGREVRPERLRDLPTIKRVFARGTDDIGDNRRWSAIAALKRIARASSDPVEREDIAQFVRDAINDRLNRMDIDDVRASNEIRELIEVLAAANPSWEIAFLEQIATSHRVCWAINRLAGMRKPALTDADCDYVRTALQRFEACGLRIDPDLDRELIVARAMVDASLWRFTDNHPPEAGMLIASDPVQDLFLALVIETDSLACLDETQVQYPALRTREKAADLLRSRYSKSIFENANQINTVNEDEGGGLSCLPADVAALTCGAIQVADASVKDIGSRMLKVQFSVNGEFHSFDVRDDKRPDITPAIDVFNSLAKSLAIGRFIYVDADYEDSITLAFVSEEDVPRIIELLGTSVSLA